MRPFTGSAHRGFSLVELLLAMTLLSMLLALAYGGLRASTQATEKGQDILDDSNRIRMAHQFVRRQLTQLLPLAFEEDAESQVRSVFRGEGRQPKKPHAGDADADACKDSGQFHQPLIGKVEIVQRIIQELELKGMLRIEFCELFFKKTKRLLDIFPGDVQEQELLQGCPGFCRDFTCVDVEPEHGHGFEGVVK